MLPGHNRGSTAPLRCFRVNRLSDACARSLVLTALVLLAAAARVSSQTVSYNQVVTQQDTVVTLTAVSATDTQLAAALPAAATAAKTPVPVTLTAQVADTQHRSNIPVGTVIFTVTDSSQITHSTAAQVANGFATSVVDASAGVYSITATYSGTPDFRPSAARTAVAVGIQDFDFSLSSTALEIAQGESANITLTIAAANGFNGRVSLACSNHPEQIWCAFSPAEVTLDSQGAQAALTISTHSSMDRPLVAGFLLAGILLLPCGANRCWRELASKGFHLLLPVTLLILMAGCVALPNYPAHSSPPSSIYRVTITATSGTIARSMNVAITLREKP